MSDIPSRFERLIVQSSFLDDLIREKKTTRGTNKALRTVQKTSKDKTPPLKGTIPSDPMFNGLMFFAPAFNDGNNEIGTPWSEPLPEPKPNKPYFVAIQISQLHGTVLEQIQGFETQWYAPPGWTWIDGKGGNGSVLYDEAISNPLYVRRVVQSPSTWTRINFKVVVIKQFKGAAGVEEDAVDSGVHRSHISGSVVSIGSECE